MPRTLCVLNIHWLFGPCKQPPSSGTSTGFTLCLAIRVTPWKQGDGHTSPLLTESCCGPDAHRRTLSSSWCGLPSIFCCYFPSPFLSLAISFGWMDRVPNVFCYFIFFVQFVLSFLFHVGNSYLSIQTQLKWYPLFLALPKSPQDDLLLPRLRSLIPFCITMPSLVGL